MIASLFMSASFSALLLCRLAHLAWLNLALKWNKVIIHVNYNFTFCGMTSLFVCCVKEDMVIHEKRDWEIWYKYKQQVYIAMLTLQQK